MQSTPPPQCHLEAEPRAQLGQTLESPRACRPAQHRETALGEEGRRRASLCALHCVQREEVRGRDVSHCLQLSHQPPMGAGGSDSDIREATLWFSGPVTPHWGSWCCVRSPHPQGRAPRDSCRAHPSRWPPPPALLLQSGFSVSPTWVPEDQLGNMLSFLVR